MAKVFDKIYQISELSAKSFGRHLSRSVKSLNQNNNQSNTIAGVEPYV
jgi:hypothetical protein